MGSQGQRLARGIRPCQGWSGGLAEARPGRWQDRGCLGSHRLSRPLISLIPRFLLLSVPWRVGGRCCPGMLPLARGDCSGWTLSASNRPSPAAPGQEGGGCWPRTWGPDSSSWRLWMAAVPEALVLAGLAPGWDGRPRMGSEPAVQHGTAAAGPPSPGSPPHSWADPPSEQPHCVPQQSLRCRVLCRAEQGAADGLLQPVPRSCLSPGVACMLQSLLWTGQEGATADARAEDDLQGLLLQNLGLTELPGRRQVPLSEGAGGGHSSCSCPPSCTPGSLPEPARVRTRWAPGPQGGLTPATTTVSGRRGSPLPSRDRATGRYLLSPCPSPQHTVPRSPGDCWPAWVPRGFPPAWASGAWSPWVSPFLLCPAPGVPALACSEARGQPVVPWPVEGRG